MVAPTCARASEKRITKRAEAPRSPGETDVLVGTHSSHNVVQEPQCVLARVRDLAASSIRFATTRGWDT
jgi:hypothetical protein